MKAKSQSKSNYVTLSLKAVFNDNVYFDPKDQVVYDMDRRMAIGYYTETHTCLIVTFIFPTIADDKFNVQHEDLTRYFNDEHVCMVRGKYIYYRTLRDYILLGTYYPDSGLVLKLPRFLPESDDLLEKVDCVSE